MFLPWVYGLLVFFIRAFILTNSVDYCILMYTFVLISEASPNLIKKENVLLDQQVTKGLYYSGLKTLKLFTIFRV